MKFNKKEAELFVPDNEKMEIAFSRTTVLCIAAHQDDIEIMAFAPIIDCYGKNDKWFTGVVVTDGAGSPRSGIYQEYTDEAMKEIRIKEQKTASIIGKYSAQFQLAYPSSEVKDNDNASLIEEIKNIIEKCNPEVIYTHNLADKHDTHVAVAIRVIQAIRLLDEDKRPRKVYSLEVWRGLDWLNDEDKSVFDTSGHPNVASALLGVYDSQIAGGKRYDLAAIGRRSSNATFFGSHSVDSSDSVSYGLDITEMTFDEKFPMTGFISKYIENFKNEVENRIKKFT